MLSALQKPLSAVRFGTEKSIEFPHRIAIFGDARDCCRRGGARLMSGLGKC
jgi:hypothetical protein